VDGTLAVALGGALCGYPISINLNHEERQEAR
jgi:hypothetical protein